MRIQQFDHLVLTVADLGASIAFYTGVLGFELREFGEGRHAVVFGDHKINLHQADHMLEPKALRPTPGSADLCFLSDVSVAKMLEYLRGMGVSVELGPVERQGAHHRLRSVYVRDPDGNLIEIAEPIR